MNIAPNVTINYTSHQTKHKIMLTIKNIKIIIQGKFVSTIESKNKYRFYRRLKKKPITKEREISRNKLVEIIYLDAYLPKVLATKLLKRS